MGVLYLPTYLRIRTRTRTYILSVAHHSFHVRNNLFSISARRAAQELDGEAAGKEGGRGHGIALAAASEERGRENNFLLMTLHRQV